MPRTEMFECFCWQFKNTVFGFEASAKGRKLDKTTPAMLR